MTDTTIKSTDGNLKIIAGQADVELGIFESVDYLLPDINAYTSSYLIFYTVDDDNYLFSEFVSLNFFGTVPSWKANHKECRVQGLYTVRSETYSDNTFVIECTNNSTTDAHTVHLKYYIFLDRVATK